VRTDPPLSTGDYQLKPKVEVLVSASTLVRFIGASGLSDALARSAGEFAL